MREELDAVFAEFSPLEGCWTLAYGPDWTLLPRRALLPGQRWATKEAAQRAARRVNTRCCHEC